MVFFWILMKFLCRDKLNIMVKTNILFAIYLIFNGVVSGDQPIKCKKTGGEVNYVGGTWTFYTQPEAKQLNLYETKEVCGHNLPNRI